MIYKILIIYGFFLLLSVVFYIPKFCQYNGARKKPDHKKATAKRKIALLVPARNESEAIGDLLDSIKRQSYDKEYFDVNVIVKDESDPTLEMARAIGANTFVVSKQKCKGDALDGYFKSLPDDVFKSYDAFVIVDADAVLTDTYVEELNNALEYDRQIYITRKLIKNFLGGKKSRSLVCNCSALTYAIVDDLGNLYRSRKNIPLNFCGQGMMLRREVIEAKGGWAYRSLTEDYELKMDSLLQKFTSMYYPYAVIYTEEVLSHKESYARRLRWLTGQSQCEKRYGRQVKEKIQKGGYSVPLKFDFLHYRNSIFLFLASTILTVIAGVFLTAIYAIAHNALWVQSLIVLIATPVLLTYVILWIFSLMAMCCYRDAFDALPTREKIVTLAFAPVFLLEFVPLYIRSRFEKSSELEWRQTERVSYEQRR